MQTALNYLNETHCLSKVNGIWKVCQLSGSSVWTMEGNRVCSRSKKQLWKRFLEGRFYYPEEELQLEVGDIVLLKDDHGMDFSYHVVDTGFDKETGKRTYIVGR